MSILYGTKRGSWARLEDSVDVVLCASEPHAKAHFNAPVFLDRFVRRISDALPADVVFHVFTDANAWGEVKTHLSHWNAAPGRTVIVYPPEKAASFGEAARALRVEEEQGRIENPWLLWMLEALRGRTADIVQFLCHGFISMDQGALALAESPLVNQDPRTARFVGSSQIAAFLTRLGAVSAAFSGPPENYSAPGLRLLAHQVAGSWPGPVLLHDIPGDPEALEMEAAYRYLYGDGQAPSSPALCLYSYPEREAAPASRSGFESVFGAVARGDHPRASRRASRQEPAWVTASQRYLEQTVADLVDAPPDSERQSAAHKGILDALDSVAEILHRHASKPEGPA